jgi:hypothetical protein
MLLCNGDAGLSGEKATSLGYRPPAPVATRPFLRDYFHSNMLVFAYDTGSKHRFEIHIAQKTHNLKGRGHHFKKPSGNPF